MEGACDEKLGLKKYRITGFYLNSFRSYTNSGKNHGIRGVTPEFRLQFLSSPCNSKALCTVPVLRG
jgi:hypothetical protein